MPSANFGAVSLMARVRLAVRTLRTGSRDTLFCLCILSGIVL